MSTWHYIKKRFRKHDGRIFNVRSEEMPDINTEETQLALSQIEEQNSTERWRYYHCNNAVCENSPQRMSDTKYHPRNVAKTSDNVASPASSSIQLLTKINLTNKLDFCQAPKQAGFRKILSTYNQSYSVNPIINSKMQWIQPFTSPCVWWL